jgi:hypothetical protein
MAYRNGTYVTFHADGNNNSGKTDMDYYNLIKAWAAKTDDEFTMISSQEKASAVRDRNQWNKLRASLQERLRNSRNMVLIIGETTRNDADWIPFEIEKAVDEYQIPIIVAYTMCMGPVRTPDFFSSYWPSALSARIVNGSASAIHIPFRKAPLIDAVDRFTQNKPPEGRGLGTYADSVYREWGITE